MKRGWLLFLTMMGFLAALRIGVLPTLRHIRQKETQQAYLTELRGQMQSVGVEDQSRQFSLAKWYNWNLNSDMPDAGFAQAYGQILSFQDGVMALLILPGGEIPIYHQGASGVVPGAEHRADTALPIGGRGNRCVLQLPEGMEVPKASEESAVAVYCLGKTLFYQPAAPEACGEENLDILVLLPAEGGNGITLRRSDVISITVEDPAGSPGLMYGVQAAAILLALHLILTGICMKGTGRIRRRSWIHRKTRGKTDISR